MAKKKISRKELLKGPDEFLTFSSRAAGFASAHGQQLQYLGLAIVLIVAGYFAMRTYLGYVNKKGQNAYDIACDTLAESLEPNKVPGDLQKPEELFTRVIDEYGLSKAARLALPQIAYVKFLNKEYDEAIVSYRKFLDKVSGDVQYKSLTNLALATCYEAKGDFKAAIETLRLVVEIPGDRFNETAMLNLARVYRLNNRPEKAKEILNQFIEKYKDSSFLPMAKAYLQGLQL